MDALHTFERTLNGLVWGWPMIVLLMGTGALLTILTGFVQFRRLGFALSEVLGKIFEKGTGSGSVTPFCAARLCGAAGMGKLGQVRLQALAARRGCAVAGPGSRST